MAICRNCGKELGDQAVTCPNCGTPVAGEGGFAWGILGCCIPVVGLVLYLIWKDEKPKSAKAAGLGALLAVCILVLSYIILFIALGSGAVT